MNMFMLGFIVVAFNAALGGHLSTTVMQIPDQVYCKAVVESLKRIHDYHERTGNQFQPMPDVL